MGVGFCPKMGCGATPRPEHLAGQRLRRRPDKCDAGCRPSGRRIPRPAASGRTRSLCRSPSSERTTNPSSRRKRQDSLSLSLVLFPPKPLHWVSAGALLGEVIKLPFCIFSTLLRGGGITTLRPLCLCRNNPARGYFSRKNGFLRVGALRRRTRCSLLHTVLFRHFCVGGGITTLGVRFMLLKRWTPAGHGGVFAVFMPPQNSPCAG